MFDFTNINVRHVNAAGIAYGPSLSGNDIPDEVRPAITEAVVVKDEIGGALTINGRHYCWGIKQGLNGVYRA